MTFYSETAEVALEVLTEFGQAITVNRETSSSFDPVLGEDTTAASSFTGYGAAFEYKGREIDGTVVQAGDIKLYLNATATVPLIDDRITIDSVAYEVMDVEQINPAGTAVLYILQLRQ